MKVYSNSDMGSAIDYAVLVGRKYFMRYTLAILYKFHVEKRHRVVVKALGKNIARAVKAVESALHLSRELYVSKVKTYSVSISVTSITRRVSGIEIEILRKDFVP